MIDSDGYRPNVGIILSNNDGKVFWARRCGQNAWQFPQGGIAEFESPEEAMYRELREETGLNPEHVEVVGCTKDWLHYKLPKHMIRQNSQPVCIGQKQIWFMLKLITEESNVNLTANAKPEFDRWTWVDYWQPLKEVVFFKKDVYQSAMTELEDLLDAHSN